MNSVFIEVNFTEAKFGGDPTTEQAKKFFVFLMSVNKTCSGCIPFQ